MSAGSFPQFWVRADASRWFRAALEAFATLLQPRYFVRPRRVLFVLTAVWVLNAFDLQFTMLEAGARSFHEVNPFAARLLDAHPSAIVAYKVILVAAGSFIMLRLRNHRTTELACWFVFATYALVGIVWQVYYHHAVEMLCDPAVNLPPLRNYMARAGG